MEAIINRLALLNQCDVAESIQHQSSVAVDQKPTGLMSYQDHAYPSQQSELANSSRDHQPGQALYGQSSQLNHHDDQHA
ncbi:MULTISPECIES: hypothetical protein [Corynebacterium]|uniref:hypothetical protein n=1 Tax=Corynebacterium TaxID=1716 RepID=UPI00118613F3|nr:MULTISPECIES: hypothetical protein [Corynebacterium]QJS16152.1 hypothetical protein HK412_07635 [Corynebacterium glutamicum]QXU44687.1 hypothetical protein KW808_09650 [[Brevibacterium] flavum]